MRPRSVLDLRKIRLADGASHFFFEQPYDFLLGEFAAQAAQRTLHLAQVTELFS